MSLLAIMPITIDFVINIADFSDKKENKLFAKLNNRLESKFLYIHIHSLKFMEDLNLYMNRLIGY